HYQAINIELTWCQVFPPDNGHSTGMCHGLKP
ncbi:unnamed protein product, partial [marine sediment metagenome]